MLVFSAEVKEGVKVGKTIMHRSINTKKGEAGHWQVRLTGCLLGNTLTCQLERVRR